MLHRQLRPQDQPAKTFIDRRQEVLTRAVVDGLQQLNEHIGQLPEGREKDAALAAVACFAMRIADALKSVNGSSKAAGPASV